MIYVIKKGLHYSRKISIFLGLKLRIQFRNKLSFDAIFTEDCLYDSSSLGSSATSINKLYGFSNSLNHHSDSIRIGWRSVEVDGRRTIELLSYVYSRGERLVSHLLYVDPLTVVNCTIRDFGSFYRISIRTALDSKHSDVYVDDQRKYKLPFYYHLFPYFGGQHAAPNDMTILVNVL